jgi:hypothetical protein
MLFFSQDKLAQNQLFPLLLGHSEIPAEKILVWSLLMSVLMEEYYSRYIFHFTLPMWSNESIAQEEHCTGVVPMPPQLPFINDSCLMPLTINHKVRIFIFQCDKPFNHVVPLISKWHPQRIILNKWSMKLKLLMELGTDISWHGMDFIRIIEDAQDTITSVPTPTSVAQQRWIANRQSSACRNVSNIRIGWANLWRYWYIVGPFHNTSP